MSRPTPLPWPTARSRGSIAPLREPVCCPASPITTRISTRSPMGFRPRRARASARSLRRYSSPTTQSTNTASQGVVDENHRPWRKSPALRRANAAAAVAAAELEIARRGLVSRRNRSLLRTGRGRPQTRHRRARSAEAADFTKLTGQREQAREAAHADIVKAQLQQQQRERELSDAKLARRESAPRTWRAAVSRSAHALHRHGPNEHRASCFARRCRAGRRKEQCRIEERAGHARREQRRRARRTRRLPARPGAELHLRHRRAAIRRQRPGWRDATSATRPA